MNSPPFLLIEPVHNLRDIITQFFCLEISFGGLLLACWVFWVFFNCFVCSEHFGNGDAARKSGGCLFWGEMLPCSTAGGDGDGMLLLRVQSLGAPLPFLQGFRSLPVRRVFPLLQPR